MAHVCEQFDDLGPNHLITFLHRWDAEVLDYCLKGGSTASVFLQVIVERHEACIIKFSEGHVLGKVRGIGSARPCHDRCSFTIARGGGMQYLLYSC